MDTFWYEIEQTKQNETRTRAPWWRDRGSLERSLAGYGSFSVGCKLTIKTLGVDCTGCERRAVALCTMPVDTEPSPLWTEFWIWFALVWPVLFTNISQTGMGLTDISFLGHYEKVAHGTNATGGDGHGTSLSTMYVGAASMGLSLIHI